MHPLKVLVCFFAAWSSAYGQDVYTRARGGGAGANSALATVVGYVTEVRTPDGPLLVLRTKSQTYDIYTQPADEEHVAGLVGQWATLSGTIEQNRFYVKSAAAAAEPDRATAASAPVPQAPRSTDHYICEFTSTTQTPDPTSWANYRVYGGSLTMVNETAVVAGEKKPSLYEALASGCSRCAPQSHSILRDFNSTRTCELSKCIHAETSRRVDNTQISAIIPGGCTADASQRFLSEEEGRRSRSMEQHNNSLAEERAGIDARFRPGPQIEPSPGIRGAGSGPSVDYGRFYHGRSYPSHPSQVSGQ